MSKATIVCDEPESLFVLIEAVLRFLLFLAELSAVKKMKSKCYLYIMTTPVSLYNIYQGEKTSNTPHTEASTCTNLLRADLSNGTQLIINIINVNKPTVFCPSLDSCLQVLKTFILLNPII